MSPTTHRPPRVLVAPDKFKGTLTAQEAAAVIADGVRDVLPDAQVRVLPLADGGEGSVDAAVAAGGRRRRTLVTGPLGAPVVADWAVIGTSAVVETSAASGLALVTPTRRSAWDADSAGTGQLLRAAVAHGARTVVLGVGGTATTDGGAGALRALGARFLAADGSDTAHGARGLADVAAVDLSGLDPAVAAAELLLCCDVEAPLLGPQGAAAVFGPQKGAAPEDVDALGSALRRFAAVLAQATGRDVTDWPWAGAGGGIAGGMHAVLGARATSGAGHFAELLGLVDALAWCDVLVVGEGSLDAQSMAGKAPVAAARRAALLGIPAVAVAGRTTVPVAALRECGITAHASAVDLAGSATASMAEPRRWTRAAAARAVQTWAATRSTARTATSSR